VPPRTGQAAPGAARFSWARIARCAVLGTWCLTGPLLRVVSNAPGAASRRPRRGYPPPRANRPPPRSSGPTAAAPTPGPRFRGLPRAPWGGWSPTPPLPETGGKPPGPRWARPGRGFGAGLRRARGRWTWPGRRFGPGPGLGRSWGRWLVPGPFRRIRYAAPSRGAGAAPRHLWSGRIGTRPKQSGGWGNQPGPW